jgi:hypothetical protein
LIRLESSGSDCSMGMSFRGKGLYSANTLPGWLGSERKSWLHAWNEQCDEVGARYFSCANNEICLKTPMIPVMLSCDSRIVRQDCLCYLMERTTVDDDAVEQSQSDGVKMPGYSHCLQANRCR